MVKFTRVLKNYPSFWHGPHRSFSSFFCFPNSHSLLLPNSGSPLALHGARVVPDPPLHLARPALVGGEQLALVAQQLGHAIDVGLGDRGRLLLHLLAQSAHFLLLFLIFFYNSILHKQILFSFNWATSCFLLVFKTWNNFIKTGS